MGFGAGSVVEGGENDDADEADGGENENFEDDGVSVGMGEIAIEYVENGESGGEEETATEGEAGGEGAQGAEVVIPRGAEEGEEDGYCP